MSDTDAGGSARSGLPVGRTILVLAAGAVLLGSLHTGPTAVAGWVLLAVVVVGVMPRVVSRALSDQDGRAYRQMADGWRAAGLEGPGSESFDVAYLLELRHPTARNEMVSRLIVGWVADNTDGRVERAAHIDVVLARATWDFRRCVGSCLDGSDLGPAGLPRLTGFELVRVGHGRWAPAQSVRGQLALVTAAAVLEAQGRTDQSEELTRRLASAAAPGEPI